MQVFDPESGLYVRGSIAIPPDHQDRLRARCEEVGIAFKIGLPQAAAIEIMCHLWGTTWPEGYAVTELEEVSKEELLRRVRARDERYQASAD